MPPAIDRPPTDRARRFHFGRGEIRCWKLSAISKSCVILQTRIRSLRPSRNSSGMHVRFWTEMFAPRGTKSTERWSCSPAPLSTSRFQPGYRLGPRHGLAPWQARRVIQHIRANIETPIRIEKMARVTKLSTSHFSRAFKRSFGASPHAYVITLRLTQARRC